MKIERSRYLKTISFAVFIFTIFFLAFFDNSKRIPSLTLVNPFADDPYDAVGSFGVQLSFFAALLSLVRAFRPYTTKEIPPHQELLILRGEAVALLSILVTLAADLVALLRYPTMWMNSFAGRVLAALVGGFLLWTVLVGLVLYRLIVKSSIAFAGQSWRRIVLFPISLLILAIYPADLLESIPGGIFTALLGMVVLFISTWALVTAIFPPTDAEFEDVLDDFTAIYRGIKSRIRFISQFEKFADMKWLVRLLQWLNPREHKWNFILLIAVITGGSLMLVEYLREGIIGNLVLLILAIFIGIEGLGIVLGYLLFGEFLGIFRKN